MISRWLRWRVEPSRVLSVSPCVAKTGTLILISLGKIADPIGTFLFEGVRSLRCQELKVATEVSKFCFPSPVGWHIQSARRRTHLDLAVMHRI